MFIKFSDNKCINNNINTSSIINTNIVNDKKVEQKTNTYKFKEVLDVTKIPLLLPKLVPKTLIKFQDHPSPYSKVVSMNLEFVVHGNRVLPVYFQVYNHTNDTVYYYIVAPIGVALEWIDKYHDKNVNHIVFNSDEKEELLSKMIPYKRFIEVFKQDHFTIINYNYSQFDQILYKILSGNGLKYRFYATYGEKVINKGGEEEVTKKDFYIKVLLRGKDNTESFYYTNFVNGVKHYYIKASTINYLNNMIICNSNGVILPSYYNFTEDLDVTNFSVKNPTTLQNFQKYEGITERLVNFEIFRLLVAKTKMVINSDSNFINTVNPIDWEEAKDVFFNKFQYAIANLSCKIAILSKNTTLKQEINQKVIDSMFLNKKKKRNKDH